jgi:hypothetical protein
VLLDAERWVAAFNEGDYPNRLAWHLSALERDGDHDELRYARELIDAGRGQFERLQRVVDDRDYRERCCRGELDTRAHSSDTPRPPRPPVTARGARVGSQPLRGRACERCGQTFAPRRSDARYCSGRCRVAAHRARRFAAAEAIYDKRLRRRRGETA